MRDTLRYQEIGSSRKYQQPEPKSTTFIIEIIVVPLKSKRVL